MRTLSLVSLFVALLIATSVSSLAWSEEVISLADPSGRTAGGTVRMEKVAGWYCTRRSDAEIILRRFNGEISTRNAEAAFKRCKPDVQVVVGVFPERGMTVVFVRLLPDLRHSYFVPEMLATRDQQEARGPPR